MINVAHESSSLVERSLFRRDWVKAVETDPR